VENITCKEGLHKYIEDGMLYIQSNNATYNILGAQVK
jgi:hypothetical protein